MKLGDRFRDKVTDISIVRVPGGWIFIDYCHDISDASSQSQCFIPFNNEFMENDTKESPATDRQQLKTAIALLERWSENPMERSILSDTYHFLNNDATAAV